MAPERVMEGDLLLLERMVAHSRGRWGMNTTEGLARRFGLSESEVRSSLFALGRAGLVRREKPRGRAYVWSPTPLSVQLVEGKDP